MPRTVLVNDTLANAVAASREASVKKRGEFFDSESICTWQRTMDGLGYIEAELVLSKYGWSVRYASGLYNWGLIYSSRSGDGSREAALKAATRWVQEDISRRYVTEITVKQEAAA